MVVLTATIARNEVADIYNVTFQATPFIETSFRYSIFNSERSRGLR